MKKVSVCIIGAGPGGATTALHLANKGISSLLIDKATFPRDKICGDALSGKVVSELNRLDNNLLTRFRAQATGLDSWGIQFIAPNGNELRVPFKPSYNPETDEPPGYIARRLDFDYFLYREAKKRPEIELVEGVEIIHYQKEENGILLTDKSGQFKVFTSLLIVANGAHSHFTRHFAGIPLEPDHYCAGLRAYYKNVAGLDHHNFIELHFLKQFLPGYFWIFPLPNGYANVGVGMLSSRISSKQVNLKKQMLELIESHPQLKKRFAQAELVGEVKGYSLPLGSKRRKISGEHYLLVGDAAHLIDPFSGEGISHAMISGRWAAHQAGQCLAEGNFSAAFMEHYDQTVYKRLGKELMLSYRMQQLLDYPRLFNFIANKATKNKALAHMLSCMFMDIDLREQLKKPSFYIKLLFN